MGQRQQAAFDDVKCVFQEAHILSQFLQTLSTLQEKDVPNQAVSGVFSQLPGNWLTAMQISDQNS